MFKLLLIVCSLTVLVVASPIARQRPTVIVKEDVDKIPNIDSLLAVAKSPLEPVTMAMSMPGARNDGQAPPSDAKTTPSSAQLVEDRNKTSISTAASFVEQERDLTTSASELPAANEGNTENESLGSTVTPAVEVSSSEASKEVSPVAPVAVTTESELEPTTTTTTSPAPAASSESPVSTTPDEIEEATTSSSAEPSMKEAEPTTTTTTTTTAPPPTTTTTTEAIKSESETASTVAAPEPTTPSEPEKVSFAEPTSTTTEQPEPSTIRSIVSTTEEVSSTTTEAAPSESSTQQPDSPKVGDDSIIDEKPSEAPSTTTAAPTETPSTTSTEAALPSTTTTTTEASTTTSTTTTVKPTTEQPAEEVPSIAKADKGKAVCDHLPTYESDELQKVFREETTYKNGTIKGKFTYINFDQRYRLVHYTRLPYGPVKIDLVEELGRPEQPGQAGKTNLSTSSPEDIPNAVLQLRNILPNSLFGFPFLGPIQQQPNQQQQQQQQASNTNKELSPKDDKSNQYFYSTDSISTPNLLSPTVPVALPPGQQQRPHQADTLSASLYENLQIGGKSSMEETKPIGDSQLDSKKQQQFQYSPSQEPVVAPAPITSTYLYSNPEPQPQPQPHYQYSPMPSLSWQNYYASSARGEQPLLVPTAPTEEKLAEVPTPLSHQPHSHEHFSAPFMLLANPQSSRQQLAFSDSNQKELLDQPEAKLKLRVKTSKSLNHQENSGTKSAQLKNPQQQQPQQQQEQRLPQQQPTLENTQSTNSGKLYRPEHRHHRQRVGKQQFEVRTPINSNPIVYHILRSPLGKMYTLHQYNEQTYGGNFDN